MAQGTDPRLAILRLLRLRDEQGGGPLPVLKEIVKATNFSERDARRACDALEAQGYIKGDHAFDDSNPSYYITTRGKGHLYNLDH